MKDDDYIVPEQTLFVMTVCRQVLLLTFLSLSKIAFPQHIDEGYFNDWDCGPHGVYGNLRLTKSTARACFEIAKDGPGRVLVKQLNPSGIVVNESTVLFLNGIISEVDQADQWGEVYEYRHYQPTGENAFRVTDLLRGKNPILPCKYAVYVYTGELLTEVQHYASSGALTEDGSGVAVIRYKRYGDSIRFAERQETSFFDVRRQPVISKSQGFHAIRTIFDEQDNKIVESYFGIRDEPITLPHLRVAKIRFEYDADNNLLRDEFHGLDDLVVTNAYGVSGVRNYYEGGYLMKKVGLDLLGNPTRALASGDGISMRKFEYDNAGNRVRESFYDESGKPMNNHAGVQEIAQFFSPANMLTKVTYFDERGNPCVNRDKVNTTLLVKDDKNRTICESNYGLDGRPLKTYSEEVYMIKRKYDAYGRQISQSYWADSGTRMTHWDGSYEEGTKYDEDGQVIEYDNYDEDGKPFMTKDGSSTMKLIRNADGLLEERQFLFAGRLIERKHGITQHYSIIRYGHDEGGKVSDLTFWGTDKQPVDATIWIDDSVSAHRIDFIYNGNRIIEQRYYKLGATDPFRIVDCLKNDYVAPSGIGEGRKNEQ